MPLSNGLDSRLRGNDEPIHTETCTASFPRKWESRTRNLKKPFTRQVCPPAGAGLGTALLLRFRTRLYSTTILGNRLLKSLPLSAMPRAIWNAASV
ncbi:hypothetical protein F7O43_08500 [Neisseria meningitidis]|nr:hypothetical protein [Neisseria meningitidis]MBG8948429.1 hypothetical protein [Neisseria meningitidis]PHP22419.1 hypothetical protein CSH32_08785 [Neisseria meningitidis]TYR44755.1 hypothetical protein FY520_07215 [Neisseria meningitidis]